MMKVKVIDDNQELRALSNVWNNLLSQSTAQFPFLRAEYVEAWWQHLGGGEWENGTLHVVIAEEGLGQSNSLVGIAPLFISKKGTESQLLLIGSVEISDYLDVIVTPEYTERFLDDLFRHLASMPLEVWQVMHWYNVLEESPTIHAFHRSAEALGWRVQQERLQPSPYIPLKETWDAYLSTVDKKQRHEIRRKIRRFEALPYDKRWYIVEQADQLDQALEDFFSLMMMDRNKIAFLTDQMRKQMQAIARAAFSAGWLQLAFLEIDGQKAAAFMNFDFANQIWVYNSGLNPNFAQYSPGWVLLGYLIQWAIAHGRHTFDFMRGDEDYKTRFGTINRYVTLLSAYR